MSRNQLILYGCWLKLLVWVVRQQIWWVVTIPPDFRHTRCCSRHSSSAWKPLPSSIDQFIKKSISHYLGFLWHSCSNGNIQNHRASIKTSKVLRISTTSTLCRDLSTPAWHCPQMRGHMFSQDTDETVQYLWSTYTKDVGQWLHQDTRKKRA